jgi:hypothetical protein
MDIEFVDRTNLKVAILFDSQLQPFWILETLQNVAQLAFVEITHVLCWEKATRQTGAGILAPLYDWFDKRRSANHQHAWQLGAIDPFGAVSDFRYVCPKSYADHFEFVDTCGLEGVDVALYLGEYRLAGPIVQIPTYGVWVIQGQYHYSLKDEVRSAVLNRADSISTRLVRLGSSPDQDSTLYQSITAVVERSLHFTEDVVAWKSANYVIRKLRSLLTEDSLSLSQSNITGMVHHSIPHRQITSTTYAQHLLKLGAAKLSEKLLPSRWMIAYRFQSTPLMPTSVHRSDFIHFSAPKDGEWADPFPWIEGQQACIFVEEIPYTGSKGHISVFNLAEIDINNPKPTTVIENDYHMSYPFLFSWQNTLYMMPETIANQTLEVYRCKKYPYDWEQFTCIFDDILIADATLMEVDGRWWMFAYQPIADTVIPTNDELFIYYADTPFGPWHSHRKNPVVTDVRHARPAGGLVWFNGSLYRPAQDCSVRYGYAIAMMRVVQLDTAQYREEFVGWIRPNWAPHLTATHTVNFHKGIAVLDGYQRSIPSFKK